MDYFISWMCQYYFALQVTKLRPAGSTATIIKHKMYLLQAKKRSPNKPKMTSAMAGLRVWPPILNFSPFDSMTSGFRDTGQFSERLLNDDITRVRSNVPLGLLLLAQTFHSTHSSFWVRGWFSEKCTEWLKMIHFWSEIKAPFRFCLLNSTRLALQTALSEIQVNFQKKKSPGDPK